MSRVTNITVRSHSSHELFAFLCGCILTVEFDEQVEAKDDRAASLQAMWQDVKMWSRSIEVIYHTEEQKEILTRVYFPFDPQVGLP